VRCAFLIGPVIGSEAYACILYPNIDSDTIERYEAIHHARTPRYVSIPRFYKEILGHLNGAFIFGTALFGVPSSMAQNPPMLDRSVQQPHDIGTANEDWRHEYQVDRSRFFFASGSHSHTENVGYFLTPDNGVEGYLREGTEIARWDDFASFLTAEIDRARSRYAQYEQMMETLQRERKSKRKKTTKIKRNKTRHSPTRESPPIVEARPCVSCLRNLAAGCSCVPGLGTLSSFV
jgi:hypothetical protein